MLFDPLFRETHPSPALRAELGIPEGTELGYIRFIGEGVRYQTVVVTPDGVAHPRRRGIGRTLRGYEWVFVVSADEAAPAWGPGIQGWRVWLARIRYGQDPAYAEVWPSPGAEPLCWLYWEGPVSAIDQGVDTRVKHGVRFLFGEVAAVGRRHDPGQAHLRAAERKGLLLGALVERSKLGTSEAHITRKLIAGDLHLPYWTLKYWLRSGNLVFDALKAEARQRLRTSLR